jgi:asparagine synthase (glutamine-hydrolysing)
MCSIMGFATRSIPYDTMKRCFDRTVSRGPDMSRIVETGSGWLCFHRLAIMGLHPEGMQPFEKDGDYVVCNGELYGFRPSERAGADVFLCQRVGLRNPAAYVP